MYTILSGEFPFPENNSNTAKAIINGEYDFDDIAWTNISNSAKDLIQSMLQVDPNKRISIKDALQHQWFNEYYKEYNRQLLRSSSERNEQYDVNLPELNDTIPV